MSPRVCKIRMWCKNVSDKDTLKLVNYEWQFYNRPLLEKLCIDDTDSKLPEKRIFCISEQQLLSYSVYPRDVTIFIINWQ